MAKRSFSWPSLDSFPHEDAEPGVPEGELDLTAVPETTSSESGEMTCSTPSERHFPMPAHSEDATAAELHTLKKLLSEPLVAPTPTCVSPCMYVMMPVAFWMATMQMAASQPAVVSSLAALQPPLQYHTGAWAGSSGGPPTQQMEDTLQAYLDLI